MADVCSRVAACLARTGMPEGEFGELAFGLRIAWSGPACSGT